MRVKAPSAETGEGKASVAGAVGVNVLTSTTRTATVDGVVIWLVAIWH